jgi:Family of unknown function (DUF6535)
MYNGTASIPSFLDEKPVSSPPKYVIWVNSLWLLSLLISLTGALSATLEQRCTLRHISITQNGTYSPKERARILAVFAGSKRFIFQDTSAIVFCLHLSFFLFMAGVLIYFFHINRATFYAVIWWIALITILYTLFTVMPISDPCDLLYTPFSSLALWAYLLLPRAVSQVFPWFQLHKDLRNRYSEGFIDGKTEEVKKQALTQPPNPISSKVDTEVLEKILLTLDEDRSLKAFFDAIPGFCCDSDLVQNRLDDEVREKLQQSLTGFLDRTFSSHLFAESDRIHRLRTCLRAAHSALQPHEVSKVFRDFVGVHRDENVRRMLADACAIAYAQDRDDKWTTLVTDVLGVPEGVFQNGDNVLLATLIHLTREALRTGRSERGVLESLSQIDVHNTIPELQHNFCHLWNEIVQDATREGDNSTPTQILAGIRRRFATLHQGNHPALTAFLGPIDDRNLDIILRQPSSHSSRNVSGHLPGPSAQVPATTSHSIPPHNRPRDTPRDPAAPPPLVSRPPANSQPGMVTEITRPGTSSIDTSDPISGSASIDGRNLQQLQGTRLTSFKLLTPASEKTPTLSGQIPAMHSQSTDAAMSTDPDAPSSTGTLRSKGG